jgi:hypothetical protein
MIDSLFIDLGNNVRIQDSLLVVERDFTACENAFPVRDTGLWQEPNLGIVHGRRAYFRRNAEFPFDIEMRVWRDGQLHFMVKCSVPELVYGQNRIPVSQEDFVTALGVLKEKLRRIGVDADLTSGRVVRVDVFKQSKMESSFRSYARLLRRIAVPNCDITEHDTTLLWRHRSGSWAINVYDKQQMGENGNPSTGTLRIELQARRPKIVERVFEISTVADLLASFQKLGSCYQRFIEKRLLLDCEVGHPVADDRNNVPMLALVNRGKRKGGQRWRSEVLSDIGLAVLCREIGLDATMAELAAEKGGKTSTDRSMRSRLHGRARRALFELDCSDLLEGRHEDIRPREVLSSLRRLVRR